MDAAIEIAGAMMTTMSAHSARWAVCKMLLWQAGLTLLAIYALSRNIVVLVISFCLLVTAAGLTLRNPQEQGGFVNPRRIFQLSRTAEWRPLIVVGSSLAIQVAFYACLVAVFTRS